MTSTDALQTAKDVVADFGLSCSAAVGWVCTPIEAFWVRFDDGCLRRQTGEVDLAAAFELRLFDTDEELRWLYQSGGQGNAVRWSDDLAAERGYARLPAKSAFQHLLWGRVAQVGDDWVRLDDARTGPLWVPLTASQDDAGKYAILRSVEYTKMDDCGNAGVIDERFTSVMLVAEDKLIVRIEK